MPRPKPPSDPLKYARMVVAYNDEPREPALEDRGVLQLAYNSRNARIGEGTGEVLPARAPSEIQNEEFMGLAGRGGRSVLSNFHGCEIKMDIPRVLDPDPASGFAAAHGGEKSYSSVEHAFQAGKGYVILRNDPGASIRILGDIRNFEMSDAGPALLKKMGGKAGRFKMSELAAEAWGEASYRVMQAAVVSKASHVEFRRALDLTGDMVLVHQLRGTPDLRISRILHELRAELRLAGCACHFFDLGCIHDEATWI